MTTATATNTNVSTTNAYFDLLEYVRDLPCVDVAAQMASSIAFACDVALTSAARQLMKNIREHHVDHGIDSLSEMTMALSDLAFAEEVMAGCGASDLGPIAMIVECNVTREIWHTLAADLTAMTFDWSGVPRNYREVSVEDMLLREVKLSVKPQQQQRIRVSVQRRAGTDTSKEDLEVVIKKRIEREEQRAVDASRALTEQAGAVLTAYQLALTHGEAKDHVEFYELSVELRRSMILAALKGAERAEEYATNSKSITDAEFDAISFTVIKIERELKAILAGSAYRMTSV